MAPRRASADAGGVLGLQTRREAGLLRPQAHAAALRFTPASATRLDVDAVLDGHTGCVNRVTWSSDGRLLASASDDRTVLLWRHGVPRAAPLLVPTQHVANLFGVQFLPFSNESRIVTCAMDCTVQLHTLRGGAPGSGWGGEGAPARTGAGGVRHASAARRATFPRADAVAAVFRCHRDRVKNVAVDPGDPNLFFSASEDGTLRQFDVRACSPSTLSSFGAANVLAAPCVRGDLVPLKGLAVCGPAPHLVALAAGDAWARVYDRRTLGPARPAAATTARPLLSFAPPHMALAGAAGGPPGRPHHHATHVVFGRRGRRLLINYSGDHAYAFDVGGADGGGSGCSGAGAGPGGVVAYGCPPPGWPPLLAPGTGDGGGTVAPPTPATPPSAPRVRVPLPAAAAAAKTAADRAFAACRFSDAVEGYGTALSEAPGSALLLASRAAAYLMRAWRGDAGAALADAAAAVAADPGYARAALRMAQALKALGQYQAAQVAADATGAAHPDDAEVAGVREEIAAALRARDARAARVGGGAARPGAPPTEGWLPDPAGPRPPPAWPPGRLPAARFTGHCNVATDIKEAVFIGDDDAVVAAGSDDGRVFLYDATRGGHLLAALAADDDIANAIAPHPWDPVLATSGIESVVRLWAPAAGGGGRAAAEAMAVAAGEPMPAAAARAELAATLDAVAERNQIRMRDDAAGLNTTVLRALAANPELLRALVERRARVAGGGAGHGGDGSGGDGGSSDDDDGEAACRVS